MRGKKGLDVAALEARGVSQWEGIVFAFAGAPDHNSLAFWRAGNRDTKDVIATPTQPARASTTKSLRRACRCEAAMREARRIAQ
jgi:hypothetical protein